jgi:hypothetical protein
MADQTDEENGKRMAFVLDGGAIVDAGTGEIIGTLARGAFDAPGHMRKIRTRQGMQDYLDVKWRVAWLRSEYPQARIVTEQIEGDADHARFRCTITLPEQKGKDIMGQTVMLLGAVGTGHGSETLQDFPDFYEKAETKAIGRACAVLGYGTDAASDFDDGEPMDGRAAAKDERAQRQAEGGQTGGRASDPNPGRNRRTEAETGPPEPPLASNVHQHAQLKALAEHGWDLGGYLLEKYNGKPIEELTQQEAKEAIIFGRTVSRAKA